MLIPQKKVLAAVIGSLAMSTFPGSVFGHGAMENPKARQWECHTQGGHWNPATMKSAACKAALDASPSKQAAFDNWNGFTGFATAPHTVDMSDVKDGMLCSGSNTGYAGFNLPRADWTKTTLQPDSQGKVGMTYYYTAKHSPSFIEFYINKKNVDPTKKALGWNDVELLKRFDIASGDSSDRHTVNVTIPEDRTGTAVIFTRWQRIDPVGEGFYNCSDVNIKSRDGSDIPDGGGEEEGGGDESDWVSKGDFITMAHQPAVGEQVRFRLMGGTRGDNLVDVYLKITAQNINNNQWVLELGRELNRNHGNELQIGQQQSDGTIRFNEQKPRENQVFVSDKSHGYAIEIVKNAEAPAISLDRYTINPIATTNSGYSYAVTGSSDKAGVSWQWTRIAGDSRITASPANQAKTQITVMGGVPGGTSATFELTGKTVNGATGKATLKVNVQAPQVAPTGPTSITSDKGGKFTAKANFDYSQGKVSYSWSLLKSGNEVPGIDQSGSVKSGLAAGDYLVKVTAELDNGERKASGTAALKITDKEEPGTGAYESWVAGKTYTAGNTVSWNGVNYMASYWTTAEPGKGDSWKLHNNAKPVAWLSTMVYQMGNIVSHDGKVWKASQWIAQGTTPGQSTLWKQQ
ncbi:lytic polysaccharide monooxygenase [Enterobacter bugandensis]|uniref:lytic polysaccharide monooxygenase n=1 Tax=Enterobacter bugandensis TaxID=881260 RepID=UPI002003B7C1|nr:lytic polysaccharide monooxygenase [Enterobacter bugandensis]MCK7068165.1 lytic polysaccharide monooxygenase [Enterobacter bugandensis]